MKIEIEFDELRKLRESIIIARVSLETAAGQSESSGMPTMAKTYRDAASELGAVLDIVSYAKLTN